MPIADGIVDVFNNFDLNFGLLNLIAVVEGIFGGIFLAVVLEAVELVIADDACDSVVDEVRVAYRSLA